MHEKKFARVLVFVFEFTGKPTMDDTTFRQSYNLL